VGRNRPAEAMPFDGMVRRYLITYNVNLLPLTNDCQQRGSTDYALGVHHSPRLISGFSGGKKSLRRISTTTSQPK